jgi:hypothetical protein
VVAEADGEGLIIGFENLAEEGLDVFLVLLDELLLASTFVDDKADAEGKLGVVGEEADFLWNAIFDDGEIILSEAGYDATVCVVNAESGVDEVGFNSDDREALRVGKDRCQKQGRDQKEESSHDGGTCTSKIEKIRQSGVRGLWRVVPAKEKKVQLILHTKILVAFEKYLSFVQHESWSSNQT